MNTLRRCLALLLATTALASGQAAQAQEAAPGPGGQLVALINAYRATLGLPAVAVSSALTRVAEAHVRDLEQARPSGSCNMHSWSNSSSEWKGCCYTADHAQSQCIWNKPREISQGAYKGDGFEISYWTSGRATPEQALATWKTSPGHHSVIINQSIWASTKWRALGVAVSEHYAVAWFGEVAE